MDLHTREREREGEDVMRKKTCFVCAFIFIYIFYKLLDIV